MDFPGKCDCLRKQTKETMPCGTPLLCFLKTIKFPIADPRGSIRFPTRTALLSSPETKGSARADELACEAAIRKTI